MARMGERRGAHRDLVRKTKGVRESTRKTLRRWEDNIKIDLPRSGMGVWIELPWLRIGTVGRHL